MIDDWQGDPSIKYYLDDLVLFSGKVFRSRLTHDSSEPVNPRNWDLVERTGSGTESLLPGNEKWCAGCHDDEPANSRMDGSGVDAPNVIGDEVLGVDASYGFYLSGHGRDAIPEIGMKAIEKECLDCHNSTFGHIDHDHRTYQIDEKVSAEDDPEAVMHAYKDSYRLKENMLIPRSGDALIDDSFALCMNTCHDAHPYVTIVVIQTGMESRGIPARAVHFAITPMARQWR
ncbi:MAG: hypothetical protein JRJ47_07105 [Deltaproteobacteria bacterium]|nr:hypothetical protein [Deltaproteobacteria bacterium]